MQPRRLSIALLVASAILSAQTQIESWITTRDRSSLFQRQNVPLAFRETGPARGQAIVVDPDQRFQTIDGFGFALTGGSAELLMKMTPAARDGAGAVTLTLTTSPNTLTDQTAVLLLADREVKAEPRAAATDPLEFVIEAAPVVAGSVVRLRVDGVESLPFERQATPPPPRLVFADSQKVTIT